MDLRQVWLQHLPKDQIPVCGQDLAFMTEAFPIGDVICEVLTGTGECAEVSWRLLRLSMAEWSLLWFPALSAWAVHSTWRRGSSERTG